MSHSSKSVGNFFLQKSFDDGRLLTLMKLTKLIYFAHGWMLGIFNRPLIQDPIEAWQFGPVIPEIYHEAKEFGSEPVVRFLREKGRAVWEEFDDQESEILQVVWTRYGHLSAGQLSSMTHMNGSPWDRVWNELGGSKQRHALIPKQLMQDYFSNLRTTGTHASGQ